MQRGRKSRASLAVVSSKPDTGPVRPQFELRRPPDHLGKPEREIWNGVIRDYEPTNLALAVLCSGLEAHQRARECREIIKHEGVTRVSGANKMIKVHPLVAVERDARAAWLSAVKALGLEI